MIYSHLAQNAPEALSHQSLALWAADCAMCALACFEEAHPEDSRPRQAIEAGRAWARGEIGVAEARTSAFAAHAAARETSDAGARAAARAAGHAAATAHVAGHARHAAAYAARAANFSISMTNETTIEAALTSVLGEALKHNEPMARHTTLKVGGPARWFWAAGDVDKLAEVLDVCTRLGVPYLFLGHGSNVLMSDAGYDGLVIQNRCKQCVVGEETTAESGVSFGSLFMQTARAGFSGLEWAIGIPGTVGGALVSNAGAYRGNIGPLVTSVRVFADGQDQTVGPEWMEFSYRDSRLRRAGIGATVILSCTLRLPERGDPETIIARAKEYQSQRRAKQPFAPSAGSFFKNVISKELAQTLPGLSAGMVAAGVVPAGFLSEACGLKGHTVGGARVSQEHANFLINAGGATASDLRTLAGQVKAAIHARFGVTLEEEVLYAGDWTGWPAGE